MPSVGVMQSVLSPAGVQAASIHHLWLLMLWVTGIVFAVVLAFTLASLVRGIRRSRNDTMRPPSQRQLTGGVVAAVITTIVILFGLLVASIWTGRTVASLHA